MLPLPFMVQVVMATAYWPLQILALTRMRGAWRFVALIPIAVFLGSSGVGLAQNSNLWPLFGLFLLPHSAIFMGILWPLYFCFSKEAKKKSSDTPEPASPSDAGHL